MAKDIELAIVRTKYNKIVPSEQKKILNIPLTEDDENIDFVFVGSGECIILNLELKTDLGWDYLFKWTVGNKVLETNSKKALISLPNHMCGERIVVTVECVKKDIPQLIGSIAWTKAIEKEKEQANPLIISQTYIANCPPKILSVTYCDQSYIEVFGYHLGEVGYIGVQCEGCNGLPIHGELKLYYDRPYRGDTWYYKKDAIVERNMAWFFVHFKKNIRSRFASSVYRSVYCFGTTQESL